jgi:hypothetical protein
MDGIRRLISIPLLVGGDRRILSGMGAIACHHGCGIVLERSPRGRLILCT